MAIYDKKEKTVGAKLRDRYYSIKSSIKPSEKLKEIFEKNKQAEQKESLNKKVARPFPTQDEASQRSL